MHEIPLESRYTQVDCALTGFPSAWAGRELRDKRGGLFHCLLALCKHLWTQFPHSPHLVNHGCVVEPRSGSRGLPPAHRGLVNCRVGVVASVCCFGEEGSVPQRIRPGVVPPKERGQASKPAQPVPQGAVHKRIFRGKNTAALVFPKGSAVYTAFIDTISCDPQNTQWRKAGQTLLKVRK